MGFLNQTLWYTREIHMPLDGIAGLRLPGCGADLVAGETVAATVDSVGPPEERFLLFDVVS